MINKSSFRFKLLFIQKTEKGNFMTETAYIFDSIRTPRGKGKQLEVLDQLWVLLPRAPKQLRASTET